jgi:rubrerythrin
MARPLESLTAQEVLALAISVEARNAERFHSFAEWLSPYDEEVGHLFREMEAEEIQHREALFRLYRERYGEALPTIAEEDLDEVVEAFEVPHGEHLIFDDLTQRAILEAGLRAEEGARGFYQRALEKATDAEVRRLYQELAAFEESHIQRLQRRLQALEAKEAKA